MNAHSFLSSAFALPVRCVLPLVCATFAASPSTAQCELGKFLASDASAADAFGSYLDLSGNRAIAGAPDEDGAGNDRGAAYVFQKVGDTWVQEAKLTALDGVDFDRFGFEVAIDGDRAVVGAPQRNEGNFDSGAAYVFEYDGSTWSQVAKLVASDTDFGDFYGIGVDVVGDRIVVGACQATQFQVFGTGRGKVYVYTGGGMVWNEDQILSASDGLNGDRFGASVSLDGGRLLIGAENDDDRGTDSGSAYVFDLNAGLFGQTQKVTASDGGPNDFYGVFVALSGDTALVGSPLHDQPANNAGAGYLYEFDGSTWSQTKKLTDASLSARDQAGLSVALDGDLAVIGAHSQDGSKPGSALVFQRTNGVWGSAVPLTAADAVAGDAFAYGVAVQGARVLAGARADDLSGSCTEFLWSPASVVSRNAGANPNSLSASAAPVIGTSITLDLDVAGTTGHALGAVVAFGSGLTFPLAGGQVLLVNPTDPSGELFGFPALPAASASWLAPVPDDAALCGFGLTAQGVHLGGGSPFALSNALDFVVGG